MPSFWASEMQGHGSGLVCRVGVSDQCCLVTNTVVQCALMTGLCVVVQDKQLAHSAKAAQALREYASMFV